MPVHGAGGQSGRTGAGPRKEMPACRLESPTAQHNALAGHRVTPGDGHLPGVSPSSLSWALDMLFVGRKGAHFPSAPSRGIFGQQEQDTYALNPLQAMIAVNCHGEVAQALPIWRSSVGVHQGSIPPEKFLSSSLTFIRKKKSPCLWEKKMQQTFPYPSAQASEVMYTYDFRADCRIFCKAALPWLSLQCPFVLPKPNRCVLWWWAF